jgi:hypothetical protein
MVVLVLGSTGSFNPTGQDSIHGTRGQGKKQQKAAKEPTRTAI